MQKFCNKIIPIILIDRSYIFTCDCIFCETFVIHLFNIFVNFSFKIEFKYCRSCLPKHFSRPSSMMPAVVATQGI